VANRKPLNFDTPAPGVFKPLDSIRREYQIDVKGAVLELYEIFAPLNFSGLAILERKSQIS